MSKPVCAVVQRQFPVPAERVYDAWLDPNLLGRWMFGPNVRDEKIVRLSIAPRVGGRFSFVVDRGGREIDHVGEYLEMERPRRLVFSWATSDDLSEVSRVILEIEALEAKCVVTLTHEMNPKWAAFTDKAAGSWKQMLDVLAGTFA
ncbi:ATPase [Opitutaceae bacterium EW11]|nr:ATPase [Opitutaceae bacterium EW11]